MQISIVNRSKLNPEMRIDSEYYKPSALAAEIEVVSKKYLPSGKLFDVCSGPFGSTVTTDKYDQTTNLRYIRGKDVIDFLLMIPILYIFKSLCSINLLNIILNP